MSVVLISVPGVNTLQAAKKHSRGEERAPAIYTAEGGVPGFIPPCGGASNWEIPEKLVCGQALSGLRRFDLLIYCVMAEVWRESEKNHLFSAHFPCLL